MEQAINQWHRLVIPLDSNQWTISGWWDELVGRVDEIRIDVEFIQGTEVVFIDNFCLAVGTSSVELSTTAEATPRSLRLYPQPASTDVVTVECEEGRIIQSVMIFDAAGGQVLQQHEIDARHGSLSINGMADGVYTVVARIDDGSTRIARLVVAGGTP